jgi:hypothetical protein
MLNVGSKSLLADDPEAWLCLSVFPVDSSLKIASIFKAKLQFPTWMHPDIQLLPTNGSSFCVTQLLTHPLQSPP